MTDPVRESLISLRRALALLIVWVGLFLVLLLVLPASPRLGIKTEERLEVVGITEDSSALIAVSMRAQRLDSEIFAYPTWPIRVYDLATGRERLLHESPEAAGPTEWLEDEFGDRYRTGVGNAALGLGDYEFRVSGDYLAVVLMALDNDSAPERLRVLNWRTGETLLDEPFDDEFRFFGDSLLVNQFEEGGRLEVWNLRDKSVARGGWLRDFQGLDAATLSNDGRWLLPSSLNRVWEVASGTSRLEIPAGTEAAAFSKDGARLGLVGRWRDREAGGAFRRWQILDIASATLLKDAEETRPPEEPVLAPQVDRLEFLEDDMTLCSTQFQRIVKWTPEGFRYGKVPQNSPHRPVPLKGTDAVVASSRDQRWGVVSRSRQPIMFTWRSLFPWNDKWSDDIFPYQLWDLTEPAGVASLGRGSTDNCWFTPDSSRVVTRSEGGISVWDVPPSRAWGKAFLWSLLAPITAAVIVVRSSRRDRAGAAGDLRSEA